MTIPLAGDDPQVLHTATIGEAWLAVAGRILADGVASAYDGLAWLQHHVARELGSPVGRLLMVVKSAHVYQIESGYVRGVLDQSKRRALG